MGGNRRGRPSRESSPKSNIKKKKAELRDIKSSEESQTTLVPYSPSSHDESYDSITPMSPFSSMSEATAHFNILDLSAKTTMNLKEINDTIEKQGFNHLENEVNEENTAVAKEIERYIKLTKMPNILSTIQSQEGSNVSTRRKVKPRYVPVSNGMIPGESHFLQFLLLKFEDIEDRRKVCPYALRDELTNKTGYQPSDIVSHGQTGFIIKVKNAKQSEKMLQLEQVLSFKCTVENFTKFNYCKGLVYIQEFWKDEPNEFKRELMEEFPNIADIEEASFIKSKGNATPLLLYFKTPAPPPHLDIPGEPYIKKVYNFKNKPMMCKKCLKYGHTKKKLQGNCG